MADLADRLAPNALKRKPSPAPGSGLRAAAFLAIAAIAAAGAGLLFSRYLDRSAGGGVPTVLVVVAAADIPVATSLRPELLSAVAWPRAHAPAGAFRETSALTGKVTLTAIAKGEAILPPRLVAGEAGHGLAAILPEAMRAVAVRVDDVVGVAGFIHPGDHVDVIVTMKPREDIEAPFTSKVILQSVRVLSVGRELERNSKQLEKAVPVTVATLLVSGPDSERLALAATRGKLLLALRGGADTTSIETPGVIPPDLLEGDRSAAPSRPEPKTADAPSPAAAPSPAPAKTRRAVHRPASAAKPLSPQPSPQREVEILRGDRFEKRQFQSSEATP